MAWKKGESGNPNGRKSLARQELGDAFLRVLRADWEANGASTVITMREKDPVAYVRVVAALMPQQVEVEVSDGLAQALAAMNDARRSRGDQPVVGGMGDQGTSAVCH